METSLQLDSFKLCCQLPWRSIGSNGTLLRRDAARHRPDLQIHLRRDHISVLLLREHPSTSVVYVVPSPTIPPLVYGR